jgi:hypothetical protein
MNLKPVTEAKLCPRCEEFVHIKPQYRLCDPCELEVLKILQHNAIALREEDNAA